MGEWHEFLDRYGLPLAGLIGVFYTAVRVVSFMVTSFRDGTFVPGYIYEQERAARLKAESDSHDLLQGLMSRLDDIRRVLDKTP